MNTGIDKLATNRVKGLRFDNGMLIISFRDGREVHIPLRLYPSLHRATSAERNHWKMIGPSRGFHWPDLDLDLSVDGLIQGLREAIPTPPRPRARRSA
jgi:hypothetical protein